MTDNPALTFDESATETVIEAFDWTTANGFIVHCNDPVVKPVTDFDGCPVEVSEFAGVVRGPETGEPTPLRDDSDAIAAYVEQQRDE